MNHNTGNQISSVEDIDSYLDLDMLTSPFSSANSSSTNLSRPNSTIQPSFPYDQYTQTVLPTFNPEDFPVITSGASSSSMSMSPDLFPGLDAELNAMMPAFFFPENNSNTIDPSSTVLGPNDMNYKQTFVAQPPPTFDGKRVYAGIHTQRAAYEKDQRAKMAAASAAKEIKSETSPMQLSRESSAASSASFDYVESKIDRIFGSMKVPKESVPVTSASSLPNITRMKKDEEEMDEDERLLASEEGKKLSSKERRQLRNKVSARAFRSRRKEYITQLEQEVANKNAENADLKSENNSLKSEIAQLQELTRSMLRSTAFSAYLEEIKIAPPAHPRNIPTEKPAATTTYSEPMPTIRKDPNPNMVDDWALSYSVGATMWNTQVFAAFDIPSGPPALQSMSGKAIRPEETFDWSQFPPPVDGFSPFRQCGMASIQEQPEETADVTMTPETEYVPPENLSDLYNEKSNMPISERIEELAPGVGLNTLLGKLEMIINGEAQPQELFEGVPPECPVSPALPPTTTTQTKLEDLHLPEITHKERCRDVAMMFDTIKAYRRVGSICGL